MALHLRLAGSSGAGVREMGTKDWRVKIETALADVSSQTVDREAYKIHVVKFELKGPVSPDAAKDLAELISVYTQRFVKPGNKDVVAVTGRGPIWLYGLIQHYLHGTVANLAFVDPKLGGAVVIAAHSWDAPYKEGDVIELPEEVLEWTTQSPAGSK